MPYIEQTRLDSALRRCFERLRRNVSAFGDRFPFVGQGNRYVLGENNHWMAAFWTGQLWLAYVVTQDDFFQRSAETHLPSFRDRLTNRVHITHDLGFLYTLSARTQWQLTGDQAARQLALEAADELARRFNPAGGYIQAWGAAGDPVEGGRFIVDCMMNIHLLYWAAEESRNPRYAEIADGHAQTSLQYLLRPDGSTYHTYFLNPQTGAPVGGKTHQGFADESLWSRGQAWAIYGFALAASWRHDSTFQQAAMHAADRFLAEITPDFLPLWDFRLPEDAVRYRDTSAGAIAAMGMWRLSQQVEDAGKAQHYAVSARRLAAALLDNAFDEDEDAQGLLRDSTYHANIPEHAQQYTVFGDYFFLECLVNLGGRDVDFWGRARP